MKTQLPSKYPWKSFREPLGVCNHRLRTTALDRSISLKFSVETRLDESFETLINFWFKHYDLK